MSAIRTLVSRFRKRTPAPSTGLERLANTLLHRASLAGADRISFGTPIGCEAPAPPSTSPRESWVAVWFRQNQEWSYFNPMPGNIVICLLEHLDSRFPGLPRPWQAEGRLLRVEHDGETCELSIRLGIELQGTFVIDLLPHGAT